MTEKLSSEEIIFRGIYRARKVGTSKILTAPSAKIGAHYALFQNPDGILIFVPIPHLEK